MSEFRLTQEQVDRFDRDGFLFVENLFEGDEVNLVKQVTKLSDKVAKGVADNLDAEGGISKIWLTMDLEDDVFGAFVRCGRIVNPLEQLLRDKVYHFHHKMMLKEPHVGGAWEWHQDYGYWYRDKLDALLFPDTASCMVAITSTTKENGCLQVIRGSHRMGRIEHGTIGTQAGANLERVESALEHLDLVHCEMDAGTALFFHGNLLHRSDQNRSPHARWSFISCYSAMHNVSCNDSDAHRKGRARFQKGADERIREIGERQVTELKARAAG